ncbi:MAG: hemolysin III family protein [Balneolaceae bacterium]|nr:hemolysin III family protein [Balneolaceae bacterium]
MKKYLFPIREPFNAFTHLFGALVALAGTVLLIQNSTIDPVSYKLSFIVYGITVFLMFASSALYHTVQVSERTEEIYRMIDHIMIYLVIAGSYTPICAIALDGKWQLGMLLGIWIFAAIGVLKKVFWLHAPRWFSTGLYLLMGWVAVIIFPQIWGVLPKGFSLWIIIGGLFYTIGAIIYGLKKPDPAPTWFGHHGIWHLFVIGGAFSHFWAIYNYLPGF